MSLDFLNATPLQSYRKIEEDLRLVNSKLDLRRFRSMCSAELTEELETLNERENDIYANWPYASWYDKPEYVEVKMLQTALTQLREHKLDKEETEVLIPGCTYYRNVQRAGHYIRGLTCHYLGEAGPANWVKFVDAAPLMKAMEVIRHGGVDDFRRIYVEMADGRVDGLSQISLSHLSESSNASLFAIESYCDERWDGPWPWEVSAPYRLKKIIEDKEEMKFQSLQEMRAEFVDLLDQLNEGEAEKFEVVSFAKDMADKIQSMIENLARLAGEGVINLKDKARTAIGDDAAMRVEHSITQPLNMAADMLSKLKVEIEKIVNELQEMPSDGLGMNGGAGDQMGQMGQMGSPGAAMGMGDGSGGGMGGPGPGGLSGMGDDLPDDGGMDGGDDLPPMDEPERAKKMA